MRPDGRTPEEIRPVKIIPGFLKYAEGSCLFELGDTKVLCAVSVEEKVPPFLRDTGCGWITAEYALLPRATETRTPREVFGRRGRSQEIQRLIGRSLRSVVDLQALGERTLWVDCDVLQADGGTRTAAITGAFVALKLAVRRLLERGVLERDPIRSYLAAISCGVVGGEILVDLSFEEDAVAEVDANFVMAENGDWVEIQVAGEKGPFSWGRLEEMKTLAARAIDKLISLQREVLS
ncbi:ribonuclease PH [Thermosulfurimonas sp. F29]|uniref:ribonuclease PH n=1 Tax=Thermosulfurimonas sp. F29 TaxID=2867247 RepID=UPI001C833AA0|nr:ribonuclease PH [Thermosulfurimonas sp. F29]MBX6422889.1 ribonuclease PH [Thermosulfurimonas sp. F29]